MSARQDEAGWNGCTAGAEVIERAQTKAKKERILALLETKPMTPKEIASAAHMSIRAFYSYRERLAGQVHIKTWRTASHQPPSPVYAAGPGQDAPKPPKQPKKFAQRKWIAKVRRDDPARYAQMLARAKVRYIKPHRDPMIAAMYGSAG